MTSKIIDGKKIASEIIAEVKKKADIYDNAGKKPRLVSIQIGDDDAIKVYIKNQRIKAAEANIDFKEKIFPSDVSMEFLKQKIRSYSIDPTTTGIIIQRPVPKHLNIRKIQGYIHPRKDVEGMHPASIGNIIYDDLIQTPCTAAAAVHILEKTNAELKGLNLVMIGHSAIVGKPAALLAMSKGATVSVCNHMTKDLKFYTKNADAIIVAAGVPSLVTGDIVKPGSTVIDVGINVINDNGKRKIVGDADFDSVSKIAGLITPVPGGVGPVTVSILMKNVIKAKEIQEKRLKEKLALLKE